MPPAPPHMRNMTQIRARAITDVTTEVPAEKRIAAIAGRVRRPAAFATAQQAYRDLQTRMLRCGGQPDLDHLNPDPLLRQRHLCGLTIIWGLQPDGPSHWTAGWLYDPNPAKPEPNRIR